jgi:hypothetical protein
MNCAYSARLTGKSTLSNFVPKSAFAHAERCSAYNALSQFGIFHEAAVIGI